MLQIQGSFLKLNVKINFNSIMHDIHTTLKLILIKIHPNAFSLRLTFKCTIFEVKGNHCLTTFNIKWSELIYISFINI